MNIATNTVNVLSDAEAIHGISDSRGTTLKFHTDTPDRDYLTFGTRASAV